MKIAVIGSNTALGRRVVNKAEDKGISVIGAVRTAENLVGNGPLVLKDYNEITLDDLDGCHYIVDTVSFPHIDHYSTDLLPVWHLLELYKNHSARLLIVGSCAFLYTDKKRDKYVLDDARLCYDNEDQRLRQCVNAWNRLKTNTDVHWSVLCPPLILDRRGYGTGEYEFGDDIMPIGLDGISSISINDYATALIEMLLRGPKEHGCMSVRATSVRGR